MGGEVRGDVSSPSPARVDRFKVPAWARWPPMRVLPKEKAVREAVIERWARLLLEWASHKGEVLVSFHELLRTHPFDVEPELLKAVLQHLVKTGRARWHGGDAALLYWRSPEEWAEDIYAWLKANFIEVFSLHDLLEAGEAFSRLPVDELRKCMSILEKAGLVKKVRKVKDFYKMVFPGVS